ncbi:MFS transporter [soil metagenome]
MSAAMRLPGFPNLAVGYMVNELGNWLGEIALAILVYEATGSAIATASLFVAMQFLPAFGTPLLVTRIETIPVRRSLTTLYVAEAACFAALALLATNESFSLAPILILAALDGTSAASARSLTRAAAVEMLTPANLLREGNSILNVGFTAGAAGGPALAGLIVAGAGEQAALFGDAVSFLAMAVLIGCARGLRSHQHDADEGGFIQRVRDGASYLRGQRALRGVIAAQSLGFIFFALILPIEVVFAKGTLGSGDVGYGVLLASWGVGMVLGSFLFAGLRQIPISGLLATSTSAIGVAYLLTAVSPTLAVACTASVLGGIGNGIQWVAMITTIQQLTADRYQARVIAVLESAGSAMPGIGFLLGGAIATLLSPRASYAVAGAGVLVVLGIAMFALRDADLTAIDKDSPPPDPMKDSEPPMIVTASAEPPTVLP